MRGSRRVTIRRVLRVAARVLRSFTPARIVRSFAEAYMLSEYIVHLLRIRKDLERSEFVFFMSDVSLGHQATRPDLQGRRFRDHYLLLVVMDFGITNPYLIECFQSMMEIRTRRASQLARWLCRWCKERPRDPVLLRRAMRVVGLFCARLPAIVFPYYDLDKADWDHRFMHYYRQWLDLRRETPALRPAPNRRAICMFQDTLRAENQELLGKWFISIYLRRKTNWRGLRPAVLSSATKWHSAAKAGDANPEECDVRDTYQPAYTPLLRRIDELGGFVFLGGDVDLRVFKGYHGWVSYSDFSVDRFLIDYYFLTQSRFLVTGLSGPATVGCVFDVPTLITNSAFFYQSGLSEKQLVVHKRVVELATGRTLGPEELFSEPVIAYHSSQQFREAGLAVVDNTADEIMSACEEMIQTVILGRAVWTEEHTTMLEWYRDLQPNWSVGALSDSRPALSALESLWAMRSTKRGAP